MAKTYSAEMHRNENASIQFNACVIGVLNDVRQTVANLTDSRKADEYALGAIHALRKVCEGERECSSLPRAEVQEWEQVFWAWFERVQNKFTPAIAKKLRANADDDFRVLLLVAVDLPEYFWRKASLQRAVQVTFSTDKQLEAARRAAEKKYPVDLGSALHQYLERCAAELTNGKASAAATEEEETLTTGDQLAIRYGITDNGRHSLSVDDFACFETAEEREQGISVTGYDVEEGVKKYLKKNAPAANKRVRLDSESSLFCAYAAEPAALSVVADILFHFAADQSLFAQYSPPEKR